MSIRIALYVGVVVTTAIPGIAQEVRIPELDSAKDEFATAKNKAEGEYRDSVVRAYRRYLSRLAESLDLASKKRASGKTLRIKAEIAQVQRDLAAFADRDYTIEYDFGRVKDLRVDE